MESLSPPAVSRIKYRNMPLQVVLTLLTCGLYVIYWFHETNREMAEHTKSDEPVLLWTLFLLIPPIFLYSYYKEAVLFERFTKGSVNRWVMLSLWLFFTPGVWVLIQSRLNEAAKNAAITSTAQ